MNPSFHHVRAVHLPLNVCRAGWSAYWEHWLEFGHGGSPALGDQPAISAKRRAACSTGTDAPTSSLDLLAIKGEFDMALARLDTINTNVVDARTEIQATHEEVKTIKQSVKTNALRGTLRRTARHRGGRRGRDTEAVCRSAA